MHRGCFRCELLQGMWGRTRWQTPTTARLPGGEKSGPVNEAGERRRAKPRSPRAMRSPGLGATSSDTDIGHMWGHLSSTGNESTNKSEVNKQDADRVECCLGSLQPCDSGTVSRDRHSLHASRVSLGLDEEIVHEDGKRQEKEWQVE